jgi:multicomponent Na+:H+ antiporter subunit D
MGPKLLKYSDVKEVPKSMLFAMGVIACIIILFGLFPGLIVENMVRPAADALVSNAQYLSAVLGGV